MRGPAMEEANAASEEADAASALTASPDTAAGNNPYVSRWARKYELVLSVPPIAQIRRSEEQALQRLLEATLRPTDTLLEIGPGTGRATVHLAARVAHVTAVEQSAEMVALL